MPTPTKTLRGRTILRLQALGFSVLIVLSWLAEFSHVPHRWFGDAPEFNLARVLARTAVLLAIWLIVHLTTRRLLRRLHELEDFLLICSWCRKVGDRGGWMSFEQYFDRKFSTGTSHGICPECAERQLQEHRAATRPRVTRISA
jgi:hypothetical protein